MRIGGRRVSVRGLALAGGGLLLLLGVAIGFSGGESGGGPVASGQAAAAYGEARAARADIDRLKARVDDLELQLRLVQAQTGYTALDGTRLPPVRDPLSGAATPPRRRQDLTKPPY